MISLLKQGPSQEPVTVAELRDHLKLDGSEDTLLASLLNSARLLVEAQTGTRLLSQTWQFLMNKWEGEFIRLTQWPIISVEAITLLGEPTEIVSPDIYHLENNMRPATIWLNEGYAWPALNRSEMGILIEAVAGYGTQAENVPEALKTSVLLLAAYWYESNDWNGHIAATVVPPQVLNVLQDYRHIRI